MGDSFTEQSGYIETKLLLRTRAGREGDFGPKQLERAGRNSRAHRGKATHTRGHLHHFFR